MAITEDSRHRLHGDLERVLGRESAAVLMEHLPPVGWADVATRRDLDGLGRELRGEMATMAAELRGEMATMAAELRGEMATLRGQVAGDIAGVHTAIADLRAEWRGDLRTLFFSLVGVLMTVLGGAVALSRLL